MKYTQSRFTLPAGSSKITQEQWDRAFCSTCGSPDPTYSHEECADAFHGVEASRNSPKCNDTSECVNLDTVPS